MKTASLLRPWMLFAALASGMSLVIACGASTGGVADGTGGVSDSAGGSTVTSGFGGQSSSSRVTGTGGAASSIVNPSCVADGVCTANASCTSACQSDTALSFSCTCTKGVYVCDNAACNRPDPCRSGGTCSTEGQTCSAACPTTSSNPSGRYTCTCRAPAARGAGFAGAFNMPRMGALAGASYRAMSFEVGGSTGNANDLFYTDCNEASACVATCAAGAQTAGASCSTPGQSCSYTGANGTPVTCDCAAERAGMLGRAGAGSRATDVWSCR